MGIEERIYEPSCPNVEQSTPDAKEGCPEAYPGISPHPEARYVIQYKIAESHGRVATMLHVGRKAK